MPNVSRAFGGPTESLIGYAQAARTQEIDVHVAAPSVQTADRAWLKEQIPDVTLHEFASAGRHAYVVAPGLWTWLWRHADQFDAVHVHGLFNPVSSLAARIGVRSRTPTVVRPFGTLSRYTFSRRSALKRLYHRVLDRPALQRVAGLHFTTAAERDEAARLSLDLSNRAHVVPPPWQGSMPPVDLGAKADRPTVLFMSRLHPKKNVTGLIDAWARLVEAIPDAQLWIAGDGEEAYVQTLHETVQRHGLADVVSFLGFVGGEEKQRVLHEAWAFALPSHQENFGVAVLEALAAGLPVLISGEVQLCGFVEKNDLGIVVDRTDAGNVATGLREILSDDAGRRRIAEQGPDTVQDTFSVERVGEQLKGMYEQVCSATG